MRKIRSEELVSLMIKHLVTIKHLLAMEADSGIPAK
jgi:hypothetical protein